jgi:heme exporter protein D
VSKQLILGSVLGSIVLFVWSAIAWTLIPWPGDPLRSFTNEDAVLQAIKENAPRSGTYLVPNIPRRTPGMTDQQFKAAQQAMEDKMAHSPIVFASIRLEPFGSMVKPLVIQYLTQLVVALLAAFLLLQTCGLSYKSRIIFLTVIGVIIFVGGHVDEWTWWGFSNAYMLMQLGALVIGWFLASLVMAKFVTGKAAAV